VKANARHEYTAVARFCYLLIISYDWYFASLTFHSPQFHFVRSLWYSWRPSAVTMTATRKNCSKEWRMQISNIYSMIAFHWRFFFFFFFWLTYYYRFTSKQVPKSTAVASTEYQIGWPSTLEWHYYHSIILSSSIHTAFHFRRLLRPSQNISDLHLMYLPYPDSARIDCWSAS
jgi:hypothetical protein